MNANFSIVLNFLFAEEGGYVFNQADPGGETNLGVTKSAWESWLGRACYEGEIKTLTPEMVTPFYREMYWDKIQGDNLPGGLDYAVFDFAVNSGVSASTKVLQGMVNVDMDGIIGEISLLAVNQAFAENPFVTIQRFIALRKAYVEQLPAFKTFGDGWTARINRVLVRAIGLMPKSC